ncbi:hypothetical protein MCHI_001833 [Candidatus Magnetoovum chiemensis]|nr:hypothetical protein MCHI_001833 [Candidatus Magnetoovum chiemensis]
MYTRLPCLVSFMPFIDELGRFGTFMFKRVSLGRAFSSISLAILDEIALATSKL